MNRVIIIIALLLLFPLQLSAQSKEHTERRALNDTITADTTAQKLSTFEQAWAPVQVDHSLGIRAGWGTGSMRREPAREGTAMINSLWNFGLNYRFDIPEQKNVGTISFELNFVQKGYAYHLYFDDSGDSYTRTYDIIELPILWQPYIRISKKSDSRLYLLAGPFISYTLGARETYFNSNTGEVGQSGEYEMDREKDYFWNYGITAGLGLNIAIGERWSVMMDARYDIQLSDMQKGPEYVQGSPFRTPVDRISVSLGAQYKFAIGKGGTKK